MNYYPEFAALLDQYLSEADRSGAWLAQRLGVNPATVTRWRNGDTRPNSPEMVSRLADVLGLHELALRQQFLHAAGYGYLEGTTTADPADPPTLEPPSTVELPPSEAIAPVDAPIAAPIDPSIAAPIDERGPATEAEHDAGEPVQVEVPHASRAGRPQLGITVKGWYKQLADRSSVQIVILTAILLSSLLLWVFITWPILTSVASVQHFAVGEWQNLSPGVAPDNEGSLTEGTRQLLYQKLSLVDALQGVAWRDAPVTDATRNALDIWIEGSYRQLNQVELTANVYGRQGVYLATVSVQGPPELDAARAQPCILELQNQLAVKILAALNIKADQATLTQMDQVPTHSCEALRLNNDAAALVMKGSLQTAQLGFEQAITLDATYADAYNNLGQLFYRQKAWQKAVTYHQRARELQPHNAIYPYNLGLDYDRLGNYRAAIQAYEQALQLDFTYVQAYNNLGFVLLQTHEFTRALSVLQQGLELDENASYLHKNLGRLYLAQGDPTRAITELQQALALFPGAAYPEAHYYLALAHQALHQNEQACAALAEYTAMASEDEPERAADAAKRWQTLACHT